MALSHQPKELINGFVYVYLLQKQLEEYSKMRLPFFCIGALFIYKVVGTLNYYGFPTAENGYQLNSYGRTGPPRTSEGVPLPVINLIVMAEPLHRLTFL